MPPTEKDEEVHVKASRHLTYVDESYWTALPAGEEWWPRFADYEDIPEDLVRRAKAAEAALAVALSEVRAVSKLIEGNERG